ncbi:MAG: ATP-binding protein [Elusimicrobiota bacterium]
MVDDKDSINARQVERSEKLISELREERKRLEMRFMLDIQEKDRENAKLKGELASIRIRMLEMEHQLKYLETRKLRTQEEVEQELKKLEEEVIKRERRWWESKLSEMERLVEQRVESKVVEKEKDALRFEVQKNELEKIVNELNSQTQAMEAKNVAIKDGFAKLIYKRNVETVTLLRDYMKGIEHRLRNFLGVILTIGQSEVKSVREKKHSEPWKTVVRQSETIAGLFSNLDNILPKTIPAFRECNLSKIVEDIVRDMEDSVKDTGIRVFKLYNADDLPLICAIPEMIRKLVENIVLNAREAIVDNTGELTVMMMYVKQEDVIVIKVIDSGAGMRDVENMFHPFFSTKQNRLGLGLFIAKWVVDLHNGEIKVELNKEKGTTVSVSLPVKGVKIG